MKKRRPAVTATSGGAFIKSSGYTLKVTNNASKGTDLDFKVDGDNGQEYNLQVTQLSDRTALVQTLFQRIGILWPAFDLEFRADSANHIVEIR